jgi:hypothetical protein
LGEDAPLRTAPVDAIFVPSKGRAPGPPRLGPYAVSKASLDMLVKIYAG